MGSRSYATRRLLWSDICQSIEYRGRWVALDNVRYDPSTAQPLEGEIVDTDEDLADLCARMRASDRTACAILHCEEDTPTPPYTYRQSVPRPRASY
jgi:hypothetical protein